MQEGDEVFFIAARKDIRTVLSEMRKLDDPIRRVVIAGGGNVGVRLAKALEATNQVKVIERGMSARASVSEKLNQSDSSARRCGGRRTTAGREHR